MSKKSGTAIDLDSFDLTEADLQLEEFDSAEYLNTKASIAAYLSFAARSGNAEHFKCRHQDCRPCTEDGKDRRTCRHHPRGYL